LFGPNAAAGDIWKAAVVGRFLGVLCGVHCWSPDCGDAEVTPSAHLFPGLHIHSIRGVVKCAKPSGAFTRLSFATACQFLAPRQKGRC
jgi:hypothetical protein